MKNHEFQLNSYCEAYWWNYGKKTLSFKGTLKELLTQNKVKYTIRKSDHEGLYNYTFKNDFGITYKARGLKSDFAFYAKQFIQMDLVRMGDKSQLLVSGVWRPQVTVNF